MKLVVPVPTEIEVDAIRCVLPVRYVEEEMSSDFPGRIGNVLTLVLELDTGRVRGWPTTATEKHWLHVKIADTGSYYLLSGASIVARREDDYVPGFITGGYGDYLIMTVESDGHVLTEDGVPWRTTPDAVVDAFYDTEA